MKHRNPIFNTLDVIFDIDWHYFALSLLKDADDISPEELRLAIMKHYKAIIRKKKKIGYDTTQDEKAHAHFKAYKIQKT